MTVEMLEAKVKAENLQMELDREQRNLDDLNSRFKLYQMETDKDGVADQIGHQMTMMQFSTNILDLENRIASLKAQIEDCRMVYYSLMAEDEMQMGEQEKLGGDKSMKKDIFTLAMEMDKLYLQRTEASMMGNESKVAEIQGQINEYQRLINEEINANNGGTEVVEKDPNKEKLDILLKKASVAAKINQARDGKIACEKVASQFPEGCMKRDFYEEEAGRYDAKLKRAQADYLSLNGIHKKLMGIDEDQSQM